MEKIREALAKARSDKAFRQQHPVADVGAYEEPSPRESNDEFGRVEGQGTLGPQVGESAQADGDGQVMEQVRDHAVIPEQAVSPDRASNYVPDAGVIDVEVDDERGLKKGEEQAPVIGEAQGVGEIPPSADATPVPPVAPEPRKGRTGLVVILVAGALVLGGLAAVHVYLMPLNDVWSSLAAGDGKFGRALDPAIEEVTRWGAVAVDLVLKLLGGPDPT